MICIPSRSPPQFVKRGLNVDIDRLIDGEWTDDRISDPISSLIQALPDKKDRNLTQQWAIWLIKRDPQRGITVRFAA